MKNTPRGCLAAGGSQPPRASACSVYHSVSDCKHSNSVTSDDSLTFVYIYDKADMQNVSDEFLDQVIIDVGKGNYHSVDIQSPEA